MSNRIQVKDVVTGAPMTIDTHSNTYTMKDENGKLVTMDLGQTDVHIDSALSNYAAGYTNWGSIADQVAPVVPTAKASDKYFTWDKDDAFQAAESLIAGADAGVPEISPRLSSTAFATLPYGIAGAVSTELAANADAPLSIEKATMRRCMNVINIAREVRVAGLLVSGNFTFNTTLGATAKWNGGSTSDPIANIYAGMEAALTPVTGIAMSERTFHDFVTNPAVQKYVASKVDIVPLPGAQGGDFKAISEKFSAILGLPPFIIGRMKKKASASTYGYIFGDNVALICSEPGVPADGMSVNTFKTFRWTGADGGADGNNVGGFLVRRYYAPARGVRGTNVVVVAHNDVEVSTSNTAGYLIINAHQ
jgi:hypothetical protein